MIELLSVFTAAVILSVGIIACRKVFFSLALRTMAMLNVILETGEDDSVKQQLLITNLSKLLLSLLLFVTSIVLIISIILGVLYGLNDFNIQKVEQINASSLSAFAAIFIGGLIPFLALSFFKTEKDYSEFSVLLHKMILNNYNVCKQLFFIEKTIYKNKAKKVNPEFIIISGLARSGTSALTTLLFESNKFHSLKYSNMPFLLSPNFWKKFYNPTKTVLKERAHADKVMFGFNSVEALEEFFFKSFLNDKFIVNNTLQEHEIDEKLYHNYLIYHNLLQEQSNTTYLSKNNNFILRYRSLRKLNSLFKVVFIFRHPVKHAYSLFKQHKRFVEIQQKDPFALEYMNWLGHHEFGMSLKHFQFNEIAFSDNHKPDTIEYWLQVWINYYTMILSLEEEPNKILLHYEDFLNEPQKTIEVLSKFMQIELPIENINKFNNDNSFEGKIDSAIETQALQLYEQLLNNCISI